MKEWMIGIEMWDSECRYEDDIIEHEILITCDSYESAKKKFDEIVSEHQKED